MSEYSVLPFQFKHLSDDTVLLVNEGGDFVFLDHDTFDLFVRHKLDAADKHFFTLKSHLFLENVRHTPCYASFLQRIQAKAR